MLNHIHYLEKLIVNMLHRKIRMNDDFGISKEVTLRLHTKTMKNHQKNWKMWNCKHCRTKMIRKHKNNSPSNWALVNNLFPIGYERWERFRRAVDGYHMSWTVDKWKSTKRHVTFQHKRKSFSYRIIIRWQGMKSRFILRISSAKNHG